MTKGALFWTLLILWLVFGLWIFWPTYGYVGVHVLIWVLLSLVGWQVFGAPLK